jgi:hypothetical protein
MNEIIERVARAIRGKHLCEWCSTNRGYSLPADCCCYDAARAALAELREPTEAMLDGARDWSINKNGRGVGNDQATGCWQAMVDAALKP